MAQPRILTFNFHEPYLCLMAQTGLAMDVAYYNEGKLARAWRQDFRPVPPNITLLEPRQWREKAQRGEYDVIIAQNEMNAADVAGFPAAGRILILHNRRPFIETSATVDTGDPLEGFGLLLTRLSQIYTFVYISESKRDSYGIPGRVIRPGIDVDAYGGYVGDLPRVARIGNVMRERNLMFDMDFQDRVCAGFPCAVVGDNPGIPDAAPAASFEALLDIYRRWRCLLHVTRQEYEDGYNLVTLEAMACGMPVVTLANRTSPIVHGENGFSSYNPEDLRAGIEQLLEDRDLASVLGARGRETVAARFPIAGFVENWRNAIFEAAERTRYSGGQSHIIPEHYPPLLLQVAPEADVWGRYLEYAAAPDHHVLTVGTELEARQLRHSSPPRLLMPRSLSGPSLMEALPQGYRGCHYLYLGASLTELPRDLDAFPGVRMALVTGLPDAAPPSMKNRIDLVFCVDEITEAALRDSGFDAVHRLPEELNPNGLMQTPEDSAAWRRCFDYLVQEAGERVGDRILNTSAHSPKTREYYEQPRQELMPYVPMTVRRHLDVGCGAGAFGAALKRERNIERVCGIEVTPDAGRQARAVLDEVMLGDIETMPLPFEEDYFDCITCADVLEHLVSPERALAKLARCLAPNGVIVISIPNVNYHEVLDMLSQGAWTYMEAGILDETHLRFFTASELPRLILDAGLEPALIRPLSMCSRERLTILPDGSVKLGKVRLTEPCEADFERLLTYQYLVVATRPGADLLAPARAALDAGALEAAYASAGQAVVACEAERHRLMGLAAARAGAYPRAEQHFKQSLTGKNTPETAGEYGILLVGLDQAEEAMPLLEYCLRERPDHDRASGALGIALMTARRYEEAWPRLEFALRANQKNVALVRPYIQCAHQRGRLDECVELVRSFAEYHSANIEMMCDYAETLLDLGRCDEAGECLDMASLVDGGSDRAASLRERLERETLQ